MEHRRQSQAAFGLGDARPARVVWDVPRLAGRAITFSATGRTVTVAGGESWGPGGQPAWTADRGIALFPSHYVRASRPVHLNELVGAFIDADGLVVGAPFAIGESATVEAPDGAVAISLGLNDDRYADNTGTLTVEIAVPEPTVIVEDGHEAK